MWGDFAYRLRRRLPDLWKLLGSWKLSIVLMVIAAELYLLLTVWSARIPAHVVQSIAGLVSFWLVYLLLLVNTGVCLWQRWGVFKGDISRAPMGEGRRPRWEHALPEAAGEAEVRRRLRGYRRLEGGRFLRQRWAALGTYLFHLSFFLIAIGFLTTLAARHESRVWAAEGETFTGEAGQRLSSTATGLINLGPPQLTFEVRAVRAEFWRDQFLFTRLEADLALPGGALETVRINDPLWVGWGTFVRLSSVGYTPRYELLDRAGRVRSSSFVKMNLFPPGQRDFFMPEGLPHRVYLRVYPDWPLGSDAPGDTVNLISPMIEAEVRRGRMDLGAAMLRLGEDHAFEGLRLRIPELRYWAELTMVRDPGAPLLFAAFVIAFLGLLLKVRGKRAEVLWVPGAGGRGGLLRGWGAAEEPGS